MVYTISLNTAIDEILVVESNTPHAHNIISEKIYTLGGKAIKTNVLLTLNDIPNKTIAVVGGETGEKYKKLIDEKAINATYIDSQTYSTRISHVIVDSNANGSTMFVERPTAIDENDIKKIFAEIDKIPQKSTVLIAGSLPEGFSIVNFEKLIDIIKKNACEIICDVSGQQLNVAIKKKVNFIKPNEEEFKELFSETDINRSTVTKHLKDIDNYAVSLGAKGCIYKQHGHIGEMRIEERFSKDFTIKSTTGCGDMFIAGYILGIHKSMNPIQTATLYSMAKALSYGSDEIDLTELKKIEKYIGV
ncbi:PfkB family carbohydrate kinase [Mollicutes bacterium LVI A0039]|nr:PfkB family carbohydrate kinase [Mollicutes bacterium LVI A0039]